jgi:uncharacterized membrane protein
MMPDPLHPAVVHLPIALATLIPVLAILGILSIQKAFLPARSWAVIVLLQATLVGTSWLALETGEEEEETVERIVAERHIETHEEAAERFMLLAGIGFLVSASGLMAGRGGAIGRLAGTLAAIAVLAAGISVGHSGGELVYKHGAAGAYLEPAGAISRPQRPDDDD